MIDELVTLRLVDSHIFTQGNINDVLLGLSNWFYIPLGLILPWADPVSVHWGESDLVDVDLSNIESYTLFSKFNMVHSIRKCVLFPSCLDKLSGGS